MKKDGLTSRTEKWVETRREGRILFLLAITLLPLLMVSCSDRDQAQQDDSTVDVIQPVTEDDERADATPVDKSRTETNGHQDQDHPSSDNPSSIDPPVTDSSLGGQGVDGQPPSSNDDQAIQVVANPDDIAVLVNKTFRLPDHYQPDDLVEPNVPFIFEEKSEKRLMRQEAAQALEQMFTAAKKDGIHLAGVSGFRSYSYQQSLFQRYVNRDGIEEASRYSARPGHSEHQTGLAMDVSGSTGKCAAQDCFAGTPEAIWLEENAAEFGFIIRYPKGKEHITGYKYEPWHLRYVGVEIAKEIMGNDLTLEEYFGEAIPVTQ